MSDDTKYHSIAVAFWKHDNGEIKPTWLYRTNGSVAPETIYRPHERLCSNVIILSNTGLDPRPGLGSPVAHGEPLWLIMPQEMLPKELERDFAEACKKLVIRADAVKA